MFCKKQFETISNSFAFSDAVRFLSFQSYLTASCVVNQLNNLEINYKDKIVGDIGTGVGIIPCILQDSPIKNIIGIDLDLELLIPAKSVAKNNKINFICASGFDIPIKENFFDLLFIRYVFQHTNLLKNIIKEIKRVLKPEGILIVIDIDDGFNVFYPELPENSRKLFKAYSEYQTMRGGDRSIARKIPSFLSENGFEDVALKPYTSSFFKKEGLGFDYSQLAIPFLLLQKELELIKNEIFDLKLLRAIEFHRGINDFYRFLNSSDSLFASKTEFIITGKNSK